MGHSANVGNMPRRTDLDKRIQINPDEAGMIEDIMSGSEGAWEQWGDEVDLILETAISPAAEVLEVEYALAEADDAAYVARVIGYPPDSNIVSTWTITFEVKS